MGQCSFQLMIGAAFIEETTVKTALKGTVHLHHFWFSKLYLGKVFVKVANNSNEREINLLKVMSWQPFSQQLPSLVIPCHKNDSNMIRSGDFVLSKILSKRRILYALDL